MSALPASASPQRRSLFGKPAAAPTPAPASPPSPARPALVRASLLPAQAREDAEPATKPRRPAPTPAETQPAGNELGRLKRLGFRTLAECLLSVPKAYMDYTDPVKVIGPQHMGKQCYFIVRVRRKTAYDGGRKVTRFWRDARRVQIDCTDGAGAPVQVVVFGNVWPWADIEPGQVVHLYGTLGEFNGVRQIERAEFVDPLYRGKVGTVYAGKAGQVKGEALALGVTRALERLDEAEVLLLAQAGLRESEFQKLTGLSAPRDLLLSLHRPQSLKEALQAKDLARRLSAETVVRRAALAKTRPPVSASAITVDKVFLEQLVSELPYPLTGDQRRAVDEIVADLRSAYPMRRLLSGDVGTGKSITFMLPAAVAYEAGADVAILAPSQLVVEQLAKELRQLFPGLPVCTVLAGDKIGEGVVVGTTALLNAARKQKKTFGLVIVDEQHKFSVEQKSSLVSKFTNTIEATATAIPRSLALVNFGGMDVSILRECPVKKVIKTRITNEHEQDKVDAFLRKVMHERGQVAVIYPLVDGSGKKASASEKAELESVVEAGKRWERRFPGRVGVLHGRLSADEKKAVIAAMHNHDIDILVSSLVIEVGVTLPSLKVMVIDRPERYGVSQLHQLRGRVARKGGTGYMLLQATAEVQDDAMERLQLLVECSDGFTLSERDMDIRGFGDVEDDAELQTGTARTLFLGAQLTHDELAKTADRLGVAGLGL